MNTPHVQAFFDRVGNDTALQKTVEAIHLDAISRTAEKLAKLSEEIGAPVTAEEFIAAVHDSPNLSDSELERVSGGIENGKIIQPTGFWGYFGKVQIQIK